MVVLLDLFEGPFFLFNNTTNLKDKIISIVWLNMNAIS